MTLHRRKSEAKPAPATRDQAEPLIARYAALLAEAEEIQAAADHAIEQVIAKSDAKLLPIETEMNDLFGALRAWWAVAGLDATEGKRKSLVLAGCQIGERTTTPALALPEDQPEEAIIADLLARPELDGDYLVTRYALCRPALIKALRAGEIHPDYRALAGHVGLGVSQREEFFIDPVTSTVGVA